MATPSTTTLTDLNDDVLLEICDHLAGKRSKATAKDAVEHPTPIKDLSLVNHRFRQVVSRPLFRQIVIGGLAQGSANGNWDAARNAISTLSSSQGPLDYVKVLTFDIYNTGNSYKATGTPDQPLSPDDVDQVVDFLKKMPNLSALTFYLPELHASSFEEQAQRLDAPGPISFPTIENLVINTYPLFMIPRCPNLQSLRICESHWRHDIFRKRIKKRSQSKLQLSHLHNLLPQTPHLTRLDAACLWTDEDTAALVAACAQIRHLIMPWVVPSYTYRLDSITKILGSGMTRLEALEVMDDGGPLSNNLSRTPSEQRYNDEYQRKSEEERFEKMARVAFSNIGSLRTLWVGSSCLAERAKTKGDGERAAQAEAQWVWTRGRNIKEDMGNVMDPYDFRVPFRD